MRAVWLTDIHLNFLDEPAISRFAEEVCRQRGDAVLVGGDIGDARSIEGYLERMPSLFGAPVYFVLGNHDFYLGSIAAVRARVTKLCASTEGLHWLDEAGAVELTARTALVGANAWADARFGDYDRSEVMLNDYLCIYELARLHKEGRRRQMQELADAAAQRVRSILRAAAGSYPRLIFLTHVPPFREACWHEGAISTDDYLPHFSCKAVGDVLIETAQAYPECNITVLCGHTHSAGEATILPGLVALTGQARYCVPQVQRVLQIE